MDNSLGYAEAYRDVIHEDAIKVGSSTRAPDYSFRIGGTRKFFLEAKKPSVNLKDDIEPAFQLRRYGWSAKLPLSILTDFEELAVYDCTVKPDKSDKASKSRLFYYTFRDYAQKWDEIASIFSKEAVLKGSFDKYASTAKSKRGTSEVDAAFLEEIEGWRDLLARNIALRNDLSQRELNYAVQQTIDRIIFLRICEDRGIELYGRLKALQQGTKVYERLCDIFQQADDRYNSGLFHFHREKDRVEAPDELTLHLLIDDKPLKEIFKNLYYPDSPYEFSVLGADILGSVYEQFLGKVIRLESGHRAVVEDKPEVKKAGGVFYTPSYIVQYIVQHTLGKLLQGRNIKQAPGIRILDPACGSGSFLIEAFQYLLNWYLARYEEDNEKYSKGRAARIRPAPHGGWRLTTEEKKRVLLEHIYGVDIDAQAVEVTKLSLLLKVLEGESDESLNSQARLIHERVLPDLERNIQCGNSLVGHDYYDGHLNLDEEAAQRINAFGWKQSFPHVFKDGGFNAVVGNPPWGGDIDKLLIYFHNKFPGTTKEHTDIFKIFIEQATNLVCPGGLTSMIVPNTVLRQNRLKDVRIVLMKHKIVSLVDLGENVFKNVVAPSCMFIIKRNDPKPSDEVNMINLSTMSNIQKADALTGDKELGVLVKQAEFNNNADLDFVAMQKSHLVPIELLGEIADITCKDAGINYQRVGTGMQDKGKSDLANRLFYEGDRKNKDDKMYWKGSDIDRYSIETETSRFCRPNYKKYIRENEVVRLNESVFNTTPKILFRQTADRLIATIDYNGVWFGRSIIAILKTSDSAYKLEYLLCLLNSKYFEFLYNNLVQEAGRVFAQVKLAKVKQLPVRIIDFSIKTDRAAHDKLIVLAEKMFELHRQLKVVKTPQDGTIIKRQISATDQQINHIIYELYDLSDVEIAQVEATG